MDIYIPTTLDVDGEKIYHYGAYDNGNLLSEHMVVDKDRIIKRRLKMGAIGRKEAEAQHSKAVYRMNKATKFLINPEVLSFVEMNAEHDAIKKMCSMFSGMNVKGLKMPNQEAIGSFLSSQIQLIVSGAVKDTFTKNYIRYSDFLQLPFDSVFFENQNVGCLIEKHETKPNLWKVWSYHRLITPKQYFLIDPKTVFRMIGSTIELENLSMCTARDDKVVMSVTDGHAVVYKKPSVTSRLAVDPKHSVIKREALDGEFMMRAQINDVCKLLVAIFPLIMFANMHNVSIHRYQMKRGEISKAIPNPMLSKYEYRVIDLFREKTGFDSLGEIKEFFQNANRTLVDRRAHIVRGHFKEIRGKLYWWNSFMRNHHNRDTLGFVDKGYDISEIK
jgi:hypothetical protein